MGKPILIQYNTVRRLDGRVAEASGGGVQTLAERDDRCVQRRLLVRVVLLVHVDEQAPRGRSGCACVRVRVRVRRAGRLEQRAYALDARLGHRVVQRRATVQDAVLEVRVCSALEQHANHLRVVLLYCHVQCGGACQNSISRNTEYLSAVKT